MPFQYPASGLTNTAEYMASGLPYALTGTAEATPVQVDFPFVTNFIEVMNHGSGTNEIAVGFTANGSLNDNKFIVQAGQTRQFKLRVKSVFVIATSGTPTFDVVAGMTQILAKQMPLLSGSFLEYNPLETSGSLGGAAVYGYDGIG